MKFQQAIEAEYACNEPGGAMNDLPETIVQLAERLEALEKRVETLEHPLATSQPSLLLEPETRATATSTGDPSEGRNLFPVFGRALLGIAGAYLLRAVGESGLLPQFIAAWAGIAYAFAWLFAATHLRGKIRFTGTIYAFTSALILAPMLWELSLRFKILSGALTAVVLFFYAATALALAWKRDVVSVLRVSWVAAAGLSLVLAVASHDILPFVATLLALATLGEFAPDNHLSREIRVIVALLADLTIWILIFVYFNQQSALSDYPRLSKGVLLAPGALLLLIFAASVCLRTILRGNKITTFETIQTTIAFFLAAVSLADFGPSSSSMILGFVCLVLAAACYALVFTAFANVPEKRNGAVFAAWSTALLLCGCTLCFSPPWAAALLGIAAVAAVAIARCDGHAIFVLYCALFLLAAAFASGSFRFAASALVGSPEGIPPAIVWLVAVCAVASYAAAKHRTGEPPTLQALHLVIAALAAGAILALLIQGLIALTALVVIPGAHHVALIRTLVLCIAVLVLAYGGANWRRLELTRLSYGMLALVGVKLFVEDLRHGHLGYIAGSIFLFAFTLIVSPRMVRTRQST